MNKKWIVVIILVVIAAIAAFVAIEYFTTSIHALPSYIPVRSRTPAVTTAREVPAPRSWRSSSW